MKTLAAPAPATNLSPPTTTEQRWRERVRAWRESGKTIEEFSAGREFAAGTLRWWSSRLGRIEESPRFVRVVPREAPVAARDLVVEVGHARIRVAPGFEPALLAAVVRALGEEER